jgi:glucosamine--fructose-6-phosphate aminotransferase (isomerizing)
MPKPGEQTREAIFAQPEWLRGVPERVGDRRYPEGLVLFTGCGTSFHAAQVGAGLAGGEAVQALELVLRPRRADVLVAVSHEGTTLLTTEAVRAFDGPSWLVTGTAESPLARLVNDVVQVAPEIEESYCHTKSYTAAVAAAAAMAGHDIAGLPAAVEAALEGPRLEPSDHDRWLIVGAGRDWPTAQEAALKLREGTFVAAEAYHTEQLLHGHLAAVDETVRALVLDGEGRAGERSRDAVRALREIGAAAELLPQADGAAERPILGILPFHLLVLDLAGRRGVNPDRIRTDEDPWKRARESYD